MKFCDVQTIFNWASVESIIDQNDCNNFNGANGFKLISCVQSRPNRKQSVYCHKNVINDCTNPKESINFSRKFDRKGPKLSIKFDRKTSGGDEPKILIISNGNSKIKTFFRIIEIQYYIIYIKIEWWFISTTI